MRDRLDRELALLRTRYGPLKELDETGLVIERFPLPSGWNLSTTRLLLLLPAGYPTTPPDNFYTDPDLRLATGAEPANTSVGHQHAADPIGH